MDIVMSLLPGGEYGGMTSGQPAITNKNETVTLDVTFFNKTPREY